MLSQWVSLVLLFKMKWVCLHNLGIQGKKLRDSV